MKTGAGLAFICVGAILAFAVTANTSVFNLHTAGWIIMIIGVVGLTIPRRTYGWLGSRMVRRTRTWGGRGPRGDRGVRVEEVAVRPYMTYRTDTSGLRAGLPAQPAPVQERLAPDGETEVIEDIYEP